MDDNELIIYGISGLGVDHRVFDYLSLNFQLVVLDWIQPLKKESIQGYAQRLSQKVDITRPFALLGVSFGGLVVVEMAKQIQPEVIILISSAETRNELRWIYRIMGKLKIMSVIPRTLLNLPAWFIKPFLGTDKKDLIKTILKDMDVEFTHWALGKLLSWHNREVIGNCTKISGTKDILMPARKSDKTIEIEGGTHFMVVDRAEEISIKINTLLKGFS